MYDWDVRQVLDGVLKLEWDVNIFYFQDRVVLFLQKQVDVSLTVSCTLGSR